MQGILSTLYRAGDMLFMKKTDLERKSASQIRSIRFAVILTIHYSLNAKRLTELGVPPGPVYSSIKDQEGDDIKLPNGKIVSPSKNKQVITC